MSAVASPLNTSGERLDGVVQTSGPTALLKRAVNSRAVTGGDVNVADQGVATHVDDAAFGVATDSVVAAGFLADETSPDSVDEGDIGVARMTLDRFQLVESRPRRNATATLSNVSASASSVTVLAANSARNGATIVNDSSALLYLKFGSSASTSSYTVVLAGAASAPFAYYEVPFGYSGIITGIWASATGNARVTEITV